MERALVVLSHGSRHPRAAEGIDQLARAAGKELGVPVQAAHLEFNEPDLLSALSSLDRPAVVVPTLFSNAYHARNDVPAAVAEARKQGFDVKLADTLGSGADVADVVASTIPDGYSPVALYAVGSSNSDANAATVLLGQMVQRRIGRPVRTVFATRPGAVSDGEYVAPLFVTDGTLLDKLNRPTGRPLGTALAPLVAVRYRSCVGNE